MTAAAEFRPLEVVELRGGRGRRHELDGLAVRNGAILELQQRELVAPRDDSRQWGGSTAPVTEVLLDEWIAVRYEVMLGAIDRAVVSLALGGWRFRARVCERMRFRWPMPLPVEMGGAG